MKSKIIIWIILIIMLVMFGVSGCMNTQIDKTAYENAILTFLQEKYGEDFTVITMYQEFSGDTGALIRATCKGTTAEETFTVRCYLDEEVTAQKLQINGQMHSVEDSYAEVLCQSQLMRELPECSEESCIIKCRVDFYNRQPTMDEYAQGLEACLRNEELRAYIKVYILSDGCAQAQDAYGKVEELVEQYAPDTGYIYFAILETFDPAYANQVYAENKNDFGNYLAQQDYADQLWFTLYEAERGLQSRKSVKG